MVGGDHDPARLMTQLRSFKIFDLLLIEPYLGVMVVIVVVTVVVVVMVVMVVTVVVATTTLTGPVA